MMINQTFTFRRIFSKKLHHIQVLTFDMNGHGGSGSLLPLPAFAPTKIYASTAPATTPWFKAI